VGFIAAISAAPTMPRVAALETRCSEITSDSANNASLVTWRTETSAARSSVRFGLHAMTFMPNAWP
jgi:hypothetical protein